MKAAVEAYEQKNYQLAQAIIDSANIILPKGFLNDCYDELGNRYQIPIYVLAKPINLKKSVNTGSAENSACLEEDSVSPKNNKKSSKKLKKKSKSNDFDMDDEDVSFLLESLKVITGISGDYWSKKRPLREELKNR